MGCNQSKIENEEAVARCKERKRYMKEAVSSRNAFAAAHSSYGTCLKNTGAALGDFAQGEVQNPQLHSNDTPFVQNPQPFEIPLPPPPLPDFSPAPLQRAVTMPEIKINKPNGPHSDPVPVPVPVPVPTIVEEDDEDLENEGSLRKRRNNRKADAPPPMPPPPSKPPDHQSMPQDPQSGAWEYFFPSIENIAGPTLNVAEEDALPKVQAKVFHEKPARVVHEDQVITPQKDLRVPQPQPQPEPEPKPEPEPEPVPVPEEMMETPLPKGTKIKQQTPSSMKHSVNLQQIFADLDDHFLKVPRVLMLFPSCLRLRACTITPILRIIEVPIIMHNENEQARE